MRTVRLDLSACFDRASSKIWIDTTANMKSYTLYGLYPYPFTLVYNSKLRLFSLSLHLHIKTKFHFLIVRYASTFLHNAQCWQPTIYESWHCHYFLTYHFFKNIWKISSQNQSFEIWITTFNGLMQNILSMLYNICISRANFFFFFPPPPFCGHQSKAGVLNSLGGPQICIIIIFSWYVYLICAK